MFKKIALLPILWTTLIYSDDYQGWYNSTIDMISSFIEGSPQRRHHSTFSQLKHLIHHKPDSWYRRAKEAIMRPLHFSTFDQICAEHRKYRHYKKKYVRLVEKIYEDLDLTPSEAVLSFANRAMIKGLKQCAQTYPDTFVNSFKRMMEKENTIHTKGNIVMYHGTSRFNYALSYLHTKLEEHCHGPCPGYLQLRQPTFTTRFEKTVNDYLKSGGFWLQFNDTQHLLFCNCALTANLNQHPIFQEDSITFFTQELTVFSIWKKFLAGTRRFFFRKKTNISIKKLFSYYGLVSFYQEHKKEIYDLLNFQAAGNIMLQIELTPSLAQRALYPAKPIGNRCSLIVNRKRTSDPLTILNALCTHPSSVKGINGTVWCLILTNDLLLDPYNPAVLDNIHFYAYSLEQEKLKAVERKIEMFVKGIPKDIIKE